MSQDTNQFIDEPSEEFSRDPEVVLRRVRDLLENPFWLPSITPYEQYARTHDDCEGDRSQQLVVGFSEDGDAWVSIEGEPLGALRFRVPMIGGGLSGRTRSALMILAEAIRLDNEERPL